MFAKRLFLYLLGFLIGCVLAYFLVFRNKNQSFFPSAIVLDSLKSKEILIEKKAECLLSCYRVSVDIKKSLENAEVIFSESSPRETPKKYVVEMEDSNGEKLKLTFELYPTTAKVISAENPSWKKDCPCDFMEDRSRK